MAAQGVQDNVVMDIQTESIIAFAPEEHLASQRVMQKCGMQFYKQDLGHGVKCHFYRMKW